MQLLLLGDIYIDRKTPMRISSFEYFFFPLFSYWTLVTSGFRVLAKANSLSAKQWRTSADYKWMKYIWDRELKVRWRSAPVVSTFYKLYIDIGEVVLIRLWALSACISILLHVVLGCVACMVSPDNKLKKTNADFSSRLSLFHSFLWKGIAVQILFSFYLAILLRYPN